MFPVTIIIGYQAIGEKEKREDGVKGYQALLKQDDVRGAQRKGFEEKLKRAEAQRKAWDQRCKALEKMVVSVEAKVRDVCARKHRINTPLSRHGIDSK